MTQRVEGVLQESRKIEFLKTVQLWFAAIFYAIGWVVGKSFLVLWRVLTFLWVALVVGFKSAKGG
jgi:hypothetical protein